MIVENKFKTIPQSYDQKKLDFKKFKFPNFLSSKSSRTRATIQIQQGCDHRCTFCIIPYGRGEALSLPVGEVSRRIEEVLSKRYKEIIFTGVDLTSYGNDLPGKPTLGNLIRRLIKLHPSIERLRLSSIDPAEVDGELMDLLKFEPRLMPHIHLSVQSGDDLILKRMKRRHLRSDVIKLCEELKSKRPNITFGADFIIGFPTEKEENFKNTLDLITRCKFSNVHLFPFSPKKGTPAERMPQVDIKKIKNRMTVARSHAVEVQTKLMQSSIGQKVNILFESMLKSYTDNFFKVELNSRNAYKNFPGSILKVKLNSLRNGKFFAREYLMVFWWFKKLKSGLSKSSEKISEGIKKAIKGKKIDDETLDDLEELLISSDLGVNFSSNVVEELRKSKLLEPTPENIKKVLQKKINSILKPLEKNFSISKKPTIYLVVGVNGVGKTATVGKIANKYINQNKKVGVVAADTFRAAAKEQLKIWSEKTGADFFSAEENSDPAALAYDSIKKAINNKLDLLIIDTAGRLHNKTDLMNELSKIIRVIKKIDISYPNEISLVLDGNIGQNSVRQAEVFKKICEINSLIITKLDGTAKGGVLVPIAELLKIPILFIGTGETKDDLVDFKSEEFTNALLNMN